MSPTPFYDNLNLDNDFETALERFVSTEIEIVTTEDTRENQERLLTKVKEVIGLEESDKELIWMVGSEEAFKKVTFILESAKVSAMTTSTDVKNLHQKVNMDYSVANITAFKALFTLSSSNLNLTDDLTNYFNIPTTATSLETIQKHLEDKLMSLFGGVSTLHSSVFKSDNRNLNSSFDTLETGITSTNVVDILKNRPLYAFAALYPMSKSVSMNKKLFSVFLYVYFIHQVAKALGADNSDTMSANLMSTIHQKLFKPTANQPGFQDFYKETAVKDRNAIQLSRDIHAKIDDYQQARATFRAHVENERYMQAELKKEQSRKNIYVVITLVLMCIVIALSAIATLAKGALPGFLEGAQMFNIYAAVLFICFLWVLVSAILLAMKK